MWVVEKLKKLVTTFHAFIVCEQPKRILSDIKTSERRISHTHIVVSTDKEDTPFHVRSKLDSHSDTTVAGKNCVILCYIDCGCDVSPFSDKYTPMKDVPILSADTGYTSANVQNYILVFNEALYIKEMQHTLINPNQCRHFGTEIQDNPYDADKPMAISSPDSEFTVFLQSEGTIIFLETWYPSHKYLEVHTHINMTSRNHWNPHQIQFPQTKYYVQEEIKGRNVSATSI